MTNEAHKTLPKDTKPRVLLDEMLHGTRKFLIKADYRVETWNKKERNSAVLEHANKTGSVLATRDADFLRPHVHARREAGLIKLVNIQDSNTAMAHAIIHVLENYRERLKNGEGFTIERDDTERSGYRVQPTPNKPRPAPTRPGTRSRSRKTGSDRSDRSDRSNRDDRNNHGR